VPICGIQFTTNAGSAVSKGFDFQGQWQITRAFEVDGTVSYTDAEFSQTYADPAILSSSQTNDILDYKGDALDPDTGPWKLTVGLQYNFSFLERDGLVRIDDTFDSARTTPIPNEDYRTAFYDPGLRPNPAVNQVSARASITVQRWNFAMFFNNLLNAHPQLDLQHQDAQTLLYEAETLRPRTFGMQASYAF